MEYRRLGASGFKVPVLSFGTGTFGGKGDFFGKWGQVEVDEAKRMVDLCFDAGVSFFDTANNYSGGASESILGAALEGKRHQAIVSTKAAFTVGSGPNDKGTSRAHLMRACEDSLKRLGTDYLDIYFMHGFDALTPVEETLRALDDLITAGKIRYIGCSNFSGWHVMKSLATSERLGLGRYVVYQGYYSLLNRDYEWELMPLALDQGLGTMVWSPLGWGRLTGRYRRGAAPKEGRIATGGAVGGPEVDEERLYSLVDALDEIVGETGRTIPEIAIAWLLTRPSVVNVIIGARDEEQLKQNLGVIDFKLSEEQIARLDKASHQTPTYPYWHQRDYNDRNPKPTEW